MDPWPSVAWKSAFRRRLVAWFRKHGRALPWRDTSDPYAIWVSEIMLQQTQVATVIPYYERFLLRFPTVAALAAADEHDVLRLWEGLGYYRRARQLHAAAKRIVSDHGGRFPHDVEAARHLPGIGRYTAGAVLSFAFDAREPILEANTLRLFARLLAFRGDPLAAAGQKLLWSAAEAILPRRSSGVLNQALIELGSQVCTPREPHCSRCPVASLCPTNRDGLQDVVPTRMPKPKIEHVREASVVVRNRGKVLLVQRASGERWAGLWDFPRFPLAADGESAVHQELIDSVNRLCKLRIEPRRLLTTLRHGVTRFRITLECHEADLAAAATNGRSQESIALSQADIAIHEQTNPFADQRWVPPAKLADYALSVTGRKIARLLSASGRRRAQAI
ncbi:MAG: A/G-specific adenine glycosylase [Pirellulales bacterium]